MANKSPSHRFPVGNKIATNNENLKRKRLKKSPLRKTLTKLQELEPAALALIEKSVKEEAVDKESLQTGKWIITNLMSLTKSAIQEEEIVNGLRLTLEAADREDEEKESEEATPTSRFSLHCLPGSKDLIK